MVYIMNVLTVANSKLHVRGFYHNFFKDMPAAFKRRKILSSAYGPPMQPVGCGGAANSPEGEEEKEEPPGVRERQLLPLPGLGQAKGPSQGTFSHMVKELDRPGLKSGSFLPAG